MGIPSRYCLFWAKSGFTLSKGNVLTSRDWLVLFALTNTYKHTGIHDERLFLGDQ